MKKRYCLAISGDYACFTRPEMKVERVSYDVITPSAARAVSEATSLRRRFIQRTGRNTSMRRMCQRIAGFQRMASNTARAADGVITSYDTRSTFISGRVKQA